MTDLQAILIDANKAKTELFRLEARLREKSFDKKADKLEKIIAKLEAWQNS